MNLYVTTAELKTYLGISGSTQDALLAMLNKSATSWINGHLGVSDLSLHKVTREVHNGCSQQVRLDDVHLVALGTIMSDEDEYTQDEEFDIVRRKDGLDYIFNIEDYFTAGYRKVFVDYAAGWNAYAMAKITVTDYAGLASGATITLGAVNTDGFTLTRGVSWTAQTSNEAEAAAIATAIDAQAGTKAFALGNVVYVMEDTNPGVATRTIASSDGTRLALSAGTLGGVDFPEGIKLAVMMLVASLKQGAKNAKVKSYTIGTKTVTFLNDADFKMFDSTLKPYERARVHVV